MPTRLRDRIPPLDATANEKDSTAWVKYFTPWGNWTWYVIEYDPSSEICYGFVIGNYPEYGSFSLEELREWSGPLGLRVERDLDFTPTLISVCKAKFGVAD